MTPGLREFPNQPSLPQPVKGTANIKEQQAHAYDISSGVDQIHNACVWTVPESSLVEVLNTLYHCGLGDIDYSCRAEGLRFLFRGKHNNKLLRGPGEPPNVKYPPEEWFSQKLDHFKPTDGRTWNQRYYTNSTFYRPGGPAFLMIGGEGPIGLGWMLYGQWIELAKIHGAICFQLEHRFYGKSHPTPNMTVENIAYLSSEQALSDLAYFIESKSLAYNMDGNKWIVFGGSYPGSLAAWARLKYPHLVYGAVSSSGPLLAKADFKEYMEVVQNSIATYSEKCLTEIDTATKQIKSALEVGGAQENITEMFRLCEPLNINNKNDVSNFFELLADNWAYVVQYNPYNGRINHPKAITVGIRSACQVMTADDGKTSLQRYAALNSVIMNSLGESCLDPSYDNYISLIKDIAFGDENSMDLVRQWTYQTCSEFGFFQTSNSSAQPFGRDFQLNFFIQQCMDIFGDMFDGKFLNSAINRTNIFYGGTGIQASRIIFVQGSIDPWHALGVTKSLSPDSPAIYINGTSHCADMMPSYPSDPPQLKSAHEEIRQTLSQWLN
ncbi:putative serine protease K12H4.7 [Hetaerina americana]|uniref:putative serine protease K12H4.7 n=1 Tax=Hetaerina americana TaxID=62018 RepID=UPI003A7F38BA